MAVGNRGRLTLLHTNDFHNRLTEAQAIRLRLLHDSLAPECLLLDAGDAIRAGNITYHPRGEPILHRMTQIGYYAMTVGNREFYFTRVGFHCKLARAGFPALCANVRPARTPQGDTTCDATGVALDRRAEAGAPEEPESKLSRAESSRAHGGAETLPVRPYIVRQTPAGWRVVVFGLTVPMITERMLARRISAYVFEDPLAAAARLVPALRGQYAPDLLIALTHIGLARDRQLAEAVPGIDLILGGHTHAALDQGEWVGGTLLAQAGAFGRFLGRVEAWKEPEGRLRLSASLESL